MPILLHTLFQDILQRNGHFKYLQMTQVIVTNDLLAMHDLLVLLV